MEITRAEALLRALASQEPMTFDIVKGEKILRNANFKCIGGHYPACVQVCYDIPHDYRIQ